MVGSESRLMLEPLFHVLSGTTIVVLLLLSASLMGMIGDERKEGAARERDTQKKRIYKQRSTTLQPVRLILHVPNKGHIDEFLLAYPTASSGLKRA